MSDFASLGLAAPILEALAAEGYTAPTPIQARAIPQVLEGHDLLGIAQTGTGKTAAFALPILHQLAASQRIRKPRNVRALVLSPTRELAAQIEQSFRVYGRKLRLSSGVVFGGSPLGRQERMMGPGLDVLVATPGRLLDLIERRALTLENVEILVLDEADQMLDLGFIHALRRIVKMLPEQRQTLFFSATMPQSIATLAREYLTNPVKVEVTPIATTAERVDHGVMPVYGPDKPSVLRTILSDPSVQRSLVFSRTKHGADKIVRYLEQNGIDAAAIHGNKSQGQRERALNAFRRGSLAVLVATDIAARGIDVDGVSHVIQYDLPDVPETYVHRIGRTARAGATGVAIALCAPDERGNLRDIERLTRSRVPILDMPKIEPSTVRFGDTGNADQAAPRRYQQTAHRAPSAGAAPRRSSDGRPPYRAPGFRSEGRSGGEGGRGGEGRGGGYRGARSGGSAER
ncbi:DEAD/DEAH box helicase [Geminicoccus roseus]|uniref:DEAD/DEAH box helicase n=1 Tax=Geminicoccus roseus TaxID=404900 RepID=UPI00042A28F3|nr:DEAD/DEAH box helicase [Geminicoccus roseus]